MKGRNYVASITVLSHINTRFSFNNNNLYKNIHDENGQKIKNIIRILPSWKVIMQKF
jgi:hypothetical protein